MYAEYQSILYALLDKKLELNVSLVEKRIILKKYYEYRNEYGEIPVTIKEFEINPLKQEIEKLKDEIIKIEMEIIELPNDN